MRPFKKIRASALQFALLVGTMVVLLLGSFLLLTQTHSLFKTQSRMLLEVIEAANTKIELSNSVDKNLPDTHPDTSEFVETSIKTSYWGGFQKTKVTANHRGKEFTKIALSAGSDIENGLAVYLPNGNLPLVLAGASEISGDAYLSAKGVKAGVISGNYFQRTRLVNGRILESRTLLPELDPNWLQYLNEIQTYIPSIQDEILEKQLENKQSFFKTTQYHYSIEPLALSESYIGNIIIKSESEIQVTSNANLIDVILVAPKITFQRGFKGSATAIAKEQIIVEESTYLIYPSVLVVTGAEREEGIVISSEEIPILFKGTAKVEGTVIFSGQFLDIEDPKTRSETHIHIAPETVVEGVIYCAGNLEHKGLVRGSVYMHQSMANEGGSKYINHLFDGKIRSSERHPEFCGILFKNEAKQIVKWLY